MKPFALWSAGKNWDEYSAPSFFVGRETELRFLESRLLSDSSVAVAITAQAGMGKTALASSFVHSHNSHFPAGTYSVRGTPSQRLRDTVDGAVSNPRKPYLLVLDDLDARPFDSLADEVNEIRVARPSARLLLLSRRNGASLPADVTLRLTGLNKFEFHELFERSLVASPPEATLQDMFDFSKGNAAFASLLARLLQAGDRPASEILEALSAFSRSTILGPDGLPLERNSPSERQILVDLNSMTAEALSRIYREPQLIHELTPRKFEEFVAELLSRLGYEVELTPASKDGGKDICVARKDHLGTFMYVVECKKYSPANPVKVNLVRQLSGVVQAERATAGILVTTSSFTRGARELEKQLSHQISLKDYMDIQDWLKHALRV